MYIWPAAVAVELYFSPSALLFAVGYRCFFFVCVSLVGRCDWASCSPAVQDVYKCNPHGAASGCARAPTAVASSLSFRRTTQQQQQQQDDRPSSLTSKLCPVFITRRDAGDAVSKYKYCCLIGHDVHSMLLLTPSADKCCHIVRTSVCIIFNCCHTAAVLCILK